MHFSEGDSPVARVLAVVRLIFDSRWPIKTAFLAFFTYACVRLIGFLAWLRGTGPYVSRPECVGGILPIGHFTSFFAWVRGGGWDDLLPAGLVMILGALMLSLVFKRGFCGWVCPVGTVWEAFWAVGGRLAGSHRRVPKWLDLAGRGFRYLFAAAFILFLLRVPVAEAVAFRSYPYMWVADIKIIRMMAEPLYVVVVLATGAISMLLGPVWCRYLCPLGGLYSALGVASLGAVTRDSDTCIHCGGCGAACHAFVDPQQSRVVRAPECDGCMDCVRACPVEGCLEPRVLGVHIARRMWPVAVVAVWLAIWGGAYLTGNWRTELPDAAFKQAVDMGVLEQRSMPAEQR